MSDAKHVARRPLRRFLLQRAAALLPWVALALVMWAAQLAWLYHRLGRPTWNEYWRWRGVYRPGIQTIEQHGGDHLPGYVFSALSPTGARWAFILSAGLYAMGAALLLWACWLIWRAARRPRKAVRRRLRRALA